MAGIVEAVLVGANFPAKVSAHWHKGTTFMVKFDEQVIKRDKMIDWVVVLLLTHLSILACVSNKSSAAGGLFLWVSLKAMQNVIYW